jgi:homoserine O-acetyltransferase
MFTRAIGPESLHCWPLRRTILASVSRAPAGANTKLDFDFLNSRRIVHRQSMRIPAGRMRMKSREPRWRHPELQSGWIDRPHQKLELGDLLLESGEAIPDFEISYVTHGKLSPAADNAILVLTAIGSIHHRLDFLIGPDRPLNPERHFIICADAIGNGMTTSPSNSRTHPDLSFPRFCIRDMVMSQQKLLDALGVGRLAAVVGASMGGMQALQWGVSAPDRMRSIVALVPMARTRPWAAAMNEVARRILTSDSGWPSGPYGAGFDAWAAQTRVITNRTPLALETVPAGGVPALVTNAVAAARSAGPDPVDWVYQSWAYDAHDVGTTPGFSGDITAAIRSIGARTLLLVPELDLYNPVEDAIEAAELLPNATLVRLAGNAGHAVAADTSPQLADVRMAISEFLAGQGGEPKRNRDAAAPSALLDSARRQAQVR